MLGPDTSGGLTVGNTAGARWRDTAREAVAAQESRDRAAVAAGEAAAIGCSTVGERMLQGGWAGYRLYASICWSCDQMVAKLGPAPMLWRCTKCDVSWFATNSGDGVRGGGGDRWEELSWTLDWVHELQLSP